VARNFRLTIVPRNVTTITYVLIVLLDITITITFVSSSSLIAFFLKICSVRIVWFTAPPFTCPVPPAPHSSTSPFFGAPESPVRESGRLSRPVSVLLLPLPRVSCEHSFHYRSHYPAATIIVVIVIVIILLLCVHLVIPIFNGCRRAPPSFRDISGA